MTDARFAGVGLSQADVTALRERFAGWPREPEPAAGNCKPGTPPSHSPGPGTTRPVAGVSRVRTTLTRPGHSNGPDSTTPLGRLSQGHLPLVQIASISRAL